MLQNLQVTGSAIGLLAAVCLTAGAVANEKHGHGAPTGVASAAPGAVSIVRSATDLPEPLAKRRPQRVRVDLETTVGDASK